MKTTEERSIEAVSRLRDLLLASRLQRTIDETLPKLKHSDGPCAGANPCEDCRIRAIVEAGRASYYPRVS